jgi:hypothetical protein
VARRCWRSEQSLATTRKRRADRVGGEPHDARASWLTRAIAPSSSGVQQSADDGHELGGDGVGACSQAPGDQAEPAQLVGGRVAGWSPLGVGVFVVVEVQMLTGDHERDVKFGDFDEEASRPPTATIREMDGLLAPGENREVFVVTQAVTPFTVPVTLRWPTKAHSAQIAVPSPHISSFWGERGCTVTPRRS